MVDMSLEDTDRTIKTEELFESTLLCEYGCDEEAKHKISNGKLCCSKYPIQCPAIRFKRGKPKPDDQKVQVVCDCLYSFIIMKSAVPRLCPNCKRLGVYKTMKPYTEWK